MGTWVSLAMEERLMIGLSQAPSAQRRHRTPSGSAMTRPALRMQYEAKKEKQRARHPRRTPCPHPRPRPHCRSTSNHYRTIVAPSRYCWCAAEWAGAGANSYCVRGDRTDGVQPACLAVMVWVHGQQKYPAATPGTPAGSRIHRALCSRLK